MQNYHVMITKILLFEAKLIYILTISLIIHLYAFKIIQYIIVIYHTYISLYIFVSNIKIINYPQTIPALANLSFPYRPISWQLPDKMVGFDFTLLTILYTSSIFPYMGSQGVNISTRQIWRLGLMHIWSYIHEFKWSLISHCL